MASQTDFKKPLQPWPNTKAFSIGTYSILACVGALRCNCKGKWVQMLNTSFWWGKGLGTFQVYQISPCSTITNLCLSQFLGSTRLLMIFNPSVHSSVQNKNPMFSEPLQERWIHLSHFLGVQIKIFEYSPSPTFICMLTHTIHSKRVLLPIWGCCTPLPLWKILYNTVITATSTGIPWHIQIPQGMKPLQFSHLLSGTRRSWFALFP